MPCRANTPTLPNPALNGPSGQPRGNSLAPLLSQQSEVISGKWPLLPCAMAILAAHVKLLHTHAFSAMRLGPAPVPPRISRCRDPRIRALGGGRSGACLSGLVPQGTRVPLILPFGAQRTQDQVCVQWCGMQRTSWSATISSGNGQGARQAYEGVRLPCRGRMFRGCELPTARLSPMRPGAPVCLVSQWHGVAQ